MELRRLQLFLAVAEHGSFTRAARSLFISQPSLSQSVKELEGQLGGELFFRLGRKVILTPAGEALIGPASRVIREFEAGRRAVQSVTGLESGRLDLSCLSSLAADPVAPMIGEFARRYPGLMVVLTSPRSPADLVRRLMDGASELGVTDAADVSRNLKSVPLVTQDLLVVLPPGRDPAPDPMPLEDLQDLPMVSTPQGTFTRNVLDRALDQAGLTVSFTVVTEQRDAIAPLVLSGAGAAILPRPLAMSLQAQGARVAGLRPRLVREVVMAHRPAALSPAAEAFVAMSLDPAGL